MAKIIYNRMYVNGPTGLGKRLMIKHIKECLKLEDYINGSDKVLKMDMCQASYMRGVYEALDLLTDIYISLKKHGSGTAMITNLLDDEFFADYIVDHFAVKQILFPDTYKEFYKEAEEEDEITVVN